MHTLFPLATHPTPYQAGDGGEWVPAPRLALATNPSTLSPLTAGPHTVHHSGTGRGNGACSSSSSSSPPLFLPVNPTIGSLFERDMCRRARPIDPFIGAASLVPRRSGREGKARFAAAAALLLPWNAVPAVLF